MSVFTPKQLTECVEYGQMTSQMAFTYLVRESKEIIRDLLESHPIDDVNVVHERARNFLEN